MRTAPLTSLFGSLGLHGCVLLVLLVATRKPPEPARTAPARPDAWAGNAVEVDAIATPDTRPNLATASATQSEPDSASTETSAPALVPTARGSTRRDVPELVPPPSPQAAPARSRPRVHRASTPDSAPLAAAKGSHDATSAPATGAFGSQGLPPGVRSLPSAFTRAIPPATGADPIWQSLHTGTQRPFTLAVEVDAEGHIASAQILAAHDGSDIPLQFEHVRQRVIALLGGGVFALQNNAAAGRDLFRITITLSDRAIQEEGAPAELVERGFEPPRGTTPGRAYFTLASGRHFEATVEVLSAPDRPLHP